MRLLLIEDYKPLQESLAQGLREVGFAVDVTGDGKEGLWYAQSNEYDVIILDLMLPGMDGLGILGQLRKDGIQTHILILTARDGVDDRVKGLEAGADDYLIKPFAFKELLARIKVLIRRQYNKKEAVFEIEDLYIDMNTQQVRRRGNIIDLTAREYALLEYLCARAGQVVSRNDIWEHVYDFHSSASSNVVDVYIGYLRKKLSPGSESQLIHTIRGRGYMLSGDGQ